MEFRPNYGDSILGSSQKNKKDREKKVLFEELGSQDPGPLG
jgi:hypothetical protein